MVTDNQNCITMKHLFMIMAVLLTAATAMSQKIKLNGYGAYVFDDGVDSYYDPNSYYDGKIQGGFQWGVGLEYMLQPSYGLELLYLRQDTKAPMDYYLAGVKHTDFDVAMNYIMVTGSRYFKPNAKINPYVGGMLGVALIDIDNPDNGNSSNATKFAWGIKGGANFQPTGKIGLKLQATLLSAVQGAGGGFYFGTGGVGTGLTTYSTVLQFALGGGVVVNLGK